MVFLVWVKKRKMGRRTILGRMSLVVFGKVSVCSMSIRKDFEVSWQVGVIEGVNLGRLDSGCIKALLVGFLGEIHKTLWIKR